MKKTPTRFRLFRPAFAIALAGTIHSEVVLQDDFSNLSQWKDLSTAVTWSGGGTIFQTVGGVARLTALGGDVSGYTTASTLKTFTALDHRFAKPINRSLQTTRVKLVLRWSVLQNSTSGEGNRFNVSFIHDYPAGGLDLSLENHRFDDFSAAWWGRPSYQARIRGGDATTAKTILQYGGGSDIEGEWEIYRIGGVPQWWIPGFNAAPGGGSPGSAGQGWVLSDTGLASTAWQTFTYTVGPGVQKIAVDGTVHGGVQTIGTDDGNPYYNTFDRLEGIRLYWRGVNGHTEIDSISITVGGPEDAVFSLVEDAGQSYPALTYVQPSGGTGTRGVNYTVDGAAYTVEYDDDLQAPWSSGGVTVASVQAADEGFERVTVRLNDPVSAGPRRFMRVKVGVPVP